MDSTALPRSWPLSRSRRLLGALSDERLAREAKRGNERAFEAIYDRYHGPLLNFCRHMLGSREDAEDALQHTFGAAFGALPRNEQPALLKPWLFRIARNHCVSVLRRRREQPVEEVEQLSSAGLSEEVEQRAELRELLVDLGHLPERQRAALLLAEAGDLEHAEIAGIIECETEQVKSLIFQARSSLAASRQARAVPCMEIREQLATAIGAGRRRGTLRHHVRSCAGCAEFEAEMRRQRQLLASALPVAPSLGLKQSVLAAAGIGGGGGAAGGGGLLAAVAGHGVAAKVSTVAVLSGGALGGVAATEPGLLKSAVASVERATQTLSDMAGNAIEPAEAGKPQRSFKRGEPVHEIGKKHEGAPARHPKEKDRQRQGAHPGGRGRGSVPSSAGGAGRPAPVDQPSGEKAVELLLRATAASGPERAPFGGATSRMPQARVEAKDAAIGV